jgi:thioredoxin 1
MKVLKFEASWCGPCKMLSKVIAESQEKISIPFEVIDIDETPNLAMQYGVRGVPTLIVLDDDGKELRRKVGMQRESDLLQFLSHG